MVSRLDRIQQRSTPLGFVIAVVYKYADDKGGYLAALIAYYAFVSLFPILLLLTTSLGVVLVGHPDWQQRVVESASSQFPVIGDQLAQPHDLSGGPWGVVIGIAGALYGASGVGQAVQNAMDTVWSVPRNNRRDPIRSRVRSVLLLLVLGAALFGTTVLSVARGVFGSFGGFASVLSIVGAFVINACVFVVAFRLGTARSLSIAEVLPGAALAALAWQLLQTFGAVYVDHVVRSASATNGVFAVVLGLLAFLYLAAVSIVLCAEVNAVRVERLHPRALLTPFTDDVTLTEGDRAVYTDQAKAQRAKGFQRVEVAFDERPEK